MTTSQQIICRIDHSNKPVVFLVDTIDNGRIKAIRDGKEEIVGLDTYKATMPVSQDDCEVLAKRYAKQAGMDTPPIIRQRLPRVYRVLGNVISRKASPVSAQAAPPSNVHVMAQPPKETAKAAEAPLKKSTRAEVAKRRYLAELGQDEQIAKISEGDLNTFALALAKLLRPLL
jgi:hypothetical protein